MIGNGTTEKPCRKKIWIDLDNSPHVLFFQPIIRELEQRGYVVFVTARDYAQVLGLADLFGLDYTKIGRHYGKHTLLKIAGLLIRSLQLLPVVLKEKPDLALSHGSRSQIFVSKIINTPAAMAFDYEHAKAIPFFNIALALVPEVLITKGVKKRASEIWGYPGIKEDVYVHELLPDPSINTTLGINEKNVVVTIRPPATSAHYHVAKSDELFEEVMNFLTSRQDVSTVLLPRTNEQGKEIKGKWGKDILNGRIIIPSQVVNGLNLLWYSDLVVSGGGTIIREAAALGVPAYSIFGGEVGGVDESLEADGRLKMLKSVDDVHKKIILKKKRQVKLAEYNDRKTLKAVVNKISGLVDGLC